MNFEFQKTLMTPVIFNGIGLHSGKNSKIKILPADENKGIVFKRIDLKNNNLINANYKSVASAKLCTTLQNEHSIKVSTVEHLLAALYIADIDNALIEIDNDEVPILDGSSKMFLDVLKKTDLKIQLAKRRYLKILEKVELIDGKRIISIEPNDSSFEVNFELNYKNKIISKQKNLVNFQNDNLKEVVEARTFCLFEDIEKIRKFGLAKGGSLDNAIVVDKDKILNTSGLRNPKEFVNHKILDLAGDFLLSGYRVIGRVNCYQGGHELTNLFLRKLVSQKKSYSIIDEESDLQSKKTSQLSHLKIAANA
tara:strand:- start:2929 stop:3855 length:927 start_codon:yes stop_codon:yes gene_type:complete